MRGHGTAPQHRWRNRPLVRERDHRRILWLWTMLAAMVVAVIPSGAYLFHQNECLELSYRVNALAGEHQRLLEEERRLRVERARLESLERIERWARREHGLIRPDDDDVLVVGSPPREGDAAPDAVRRASNRSAGAERSGRGEPSYR